MCQVVQNAAASNTTIDGESSRGGLALSLLSAAAAAAAAAPARSAHTHNMPGTARQQVADTAVAAAAERCYVVNPQQVQELG